MTHADVPRFAHEMIAQRWLEHDLPAARKHAELALGDPLFRVRCSDAELERLRHILSGSGSSLFEGRKALSALFCLFAVETLRRDYRGGAWSWDIVTRRLGRSIDNHTLTNLTAVGLEEWRRRLRRDARGRQFLRTLILEGGFPRYFVERGSAQLSYFLKALLLDVERYEVTDAEKAEAFARQREYLLPQAWRNPDTFALAAELVIALVPLRKRVAHVGETVEAIKQLDTVTPEWRTQLPIDLGDEAAKQLIASLVKVKATGSNTQRLTSLCYRTLSRIGGHLSPAIVLSEIGLVPTETLRAEVFEKTDPPHRVRLHLIGDDGVARAQPLGYLDNAGSAGWKWVPLVDRPIEWAFGQPVVCQLTINSDDVGRLGLPGGMPLDSNGALVFEDDDEEADEGSPQQLRLMGSGSRDTRRARLFLLCRPEVGELTALEGEATPQPEKIGEKELVEITGSVAWREHGAVFGLRLRAKRSQSKSDQFGLRFQEPSWMVKFPRTSLGPPIGRVVAPQRDPPKVMWRAVGTVTWVGLEKGEWPVGQIEVVLVKDAIIWDRLEVLILPKDTRLVARSAGERTTIVDILGLGDCEARIPHVDKTVKESVPGGIRLTVQWKGTPPAFLAVRTRFAAHERSVDIEHRLHMPFTAGVIANAQGQLVSGHRRFQFNDLAQLWAQASAGGEGECFARVDGVTSGPCKNHRLGHVTRFRDEYALVRLRQTFERLYSTAGTLDADVRLSVLSGGVEGGVIRVAPFDRDLTIDPANRTCSFKIDPSRMVPLPGAELAAWSITDPAQGVMSLEVAGENKWRLPETAEPGTWMILGHGAAKGRVRPRVWNTRAIPQDVRSIVDAVAVPSVSSRTEAIQKYVAEIASDPWSDRFEGDWAYLDQLLENAIAQVPLLSLDVLVELVRNPSLAGAWLLRSAGEKRQRVAAIDNGLPFLWSLVPVETWRSIAKDSQRHFQSITGSLDTANLVMKDVLVDVARLCPQALTGCWVMRETLSLEHSEGEPTFAALKTQQFQALLRQQIGQPAEPSAWVAAISSEADWSNLGGDFLRGAALVAAELSLSGAAAADEVVAALRVCRDRGPDDFDYLFRCAVQLGLS